MACFNMGIHAQSEHIHHDIEKNYQPIKLLLKKLLIARREITMCCPHLFLNVYLFI